MLLQNGTLLSVCEEQCRQWCHRFLDCMVINRHAVIPRADDGDLLRTPWFIPYVAIATLHYPVCFLPHTNGHCVTPHLACALKVMEETLYELFSTDRKNMWNILAARGNRYKSTVPMNSMSCSKLSHPEGTCKCNPVTKPFACHSILSLLP